ncbi:MAG: transglutaminase family protein [Deltaproteobacteria bacterium]|nr:transglutaminase family protein [Deltaproteobacteria bacterium]
MPPEGEFAFNILTTTNSNWDIFFSWWRGLIKGKTEPDEAIMRKVDEFIKGLNSRRAKIEVLFDFVKREIRYVSISLGKSGYEPTPAKEVFENKYGDCKDKSTLLISMLSAAGIPAHYVLIPTHYSGKLIKDIPFPFQFDHCIVAAEGKDGYLFLDPTVEECRFGYLPACDQNRDVLIFKDHEVLFARTPVEEPQASGKFSRQAIRIERDGSIEVSATDTYAGDFESFRRWFYINNSPTEIREMFENRVDWISAGAKLIEYSHSDPLNFKEQFYERLKYYAPDHCQRAQDILTFRIPGIWSICPESGKKERRYPLDIWRRDYRNHKVEITVPEGYKVYHLPKPIDLQCPYFEFRSSYSKEDGKVFYKQEFIQKATRISPEEYPSYRKFCKEMEKTSEKQTIFFIKKR